MSTEEGSDIRNDSHVDELGLEDQHDIHRIRVSSNSIQEEASQSTGLLTRSRKKRAGEKSGKVQQRRRVVGTMGSGGNEKDVTMKDAGDEANEVEIIEDNSVFLMSGKGDGSQDGPLKKSKKVVTALDAVLYRSGKDARNNIENHVSLVRKLIKVVLELCKVEDLLDTVAQSGVVEKVIEVLKLINESPVERKKVPGFEELERDITFILGLMAIKVEHQQGICDANALPTLVGIVQRYSRYVRKDLTGIAAQTCRRAADAITNLAHENNSVKNMVREENGIPPLVYLLRSVEPKVQRAVAGTLRTLAFKNEANKDLIVGENALEVLVQMLRSDDSSIHYEAVGVIGNLVHSSQHIKVTVLKEGALQPVIDLLSSPCPDSQREAALLLGQFATVEADYKCKIVQRGAVPPLVTMLSNSDPQLKEMAAFALGRLAQHPDNQAGIVAMGGLKPLLTLLDSDQANLQHNAAFALYGLSENEDNMLHFVRDGAIQIIQEVVLGPQASRDCVVKMTRRLQEKLDDPIVGQILYIFSTNKKEQKTIAINLGLLCTSDQPIPSPLNVANRLVSKDVHKVLASIVSDVNAPINQQRVASTALANIVRYSEMMEEQHEAILPPEPNQYVGGQYVAKKALSDVVFLIEDKPFYAHKIALQASSEVFKSMFQGDYKEKEAETIPIPNIRWEVFEAMMTCIYTGTVEVKPGLAQDLLEAADRYMLDNLKQLCQDAIAKQITSSNVSAVFDLAEAYDATILATLCTMYCLDGNEVTCFGNRRSYCRAMQKMTNKLIQNMEEHLEHIAVNNMHGVPADETLMLED